VPFLCTLHHIPSTYIKYHQYLSKLFILNLFITHAQSVPYALKGIESVISSDPPCKDDNALFINGTLETLIWFKVWKILSFFWLEKCFFLWVSPLLVLSKKGATHFRRETANEINSLKKQKHWYLIHTWSDKALKDTVV